MYGSAMAPPSSFGASGVGAGQALPPPRWARTQSCNSRSPPQQQFYGRGGGTSSSSSIAVDASVVRKRGREGARHELVGETSMDCASCFGVSAEAEVGGGEHGGGGVYSVPMGADNAEADRIGSADSSQERGREKEGSEGGRFGVGVAPLVGLVGLGKQRRAGGGDSGGDGLSEDVECAICMEVIASWETVKLPCCHRFCASCVGEIYSGRNATRDTQGKSTSKKVSGAQHLGPPHRLASPSIPSNATTT
mmetsp:Transcript_16564/g.38683  ORF Transcript_16564/g.38683 Transcript_16564/m.38683 type:complete len:250 (-) Transcript_16564:549-1298(-)